VRTDVLPLVYVNADLMADEWTAVAGRPPSCRRSGCGEPAVDDRQLCREHGWSQPGVPVNMRRPVYMRKRAPAHMDHDLPLGARATRGSGAWTERAACRDALESDFFADLYQAHRAAEIATAKAICATCPVPKQCLSAGLNEEFGIWGGLTAEERRRLPGPRRQRAG
jgi:WhiB family redox-sensing transcriptional regulator